MQMTDKTPAGWVVQLTVSSDLKERTEGAVASASTFQFFNVAEPSAAKAVDAARRKAGASADTPMRVVRALSQSEISALGLRSGQVKIA